MPQFDPELIQIMRSVLEDIMAKVPLEHSTPASEGIPCRVYLEGRSAGAYRLRRAHLCGIRPDTGDFYPE